MCTYHFYSLRDKIAPMGLRLPLSQHPGDLMAYNLRVSSSTYTVQKFLPQNCRLIGIMAA